MAKYSWFPKCSRDTKVFKSAKSDSYNSYHVLKSTGLKRGLYLKNDNMPTPSPSRRPCMCGHIDCGLGDRGCCFPLLPTPRTLWREQRAHIPKLETGARRVEGGMGEVFPLKEERDRSQGVSPFKVGNVGRSVNGFPSSKEERFLLSLDGAT